MKGLGFSVLGVVIGMLATVVIYDVHDSAPTALDRFLACEDKGVKACGKYKNREVPDELSLTYAECITAVNDVCQGSQ